MFSRTCERCGSDDLVIVPLWEGHWRKECRSCRSTGPFILNKNSAVALVAGELRVIDLPVDP